MKKRHHTVPRCYLQNFTDGEGFVWVLDVNNKIFKIKPENILVENHFYTITLKNGERSLVVEDTLADLEGKYALIYEEKISKNLPLSLEDKAVVSVFISAMMHRTRPNREGMRKMFEKMRDTLQEWREEYKSNPKARDNASAMPSSGRSISLEEIEKGLEDFDEHHSAGLPDWMVSTAQPLFNMKWTIIRSEDPNQRFVTSDDPVSMRRPQSEMKYGRNAVGAVAGLVYRDVEVTIPLSKDQILLAGWILNDDTYSYMPANMMEGLNQRTILSSGEKVLSSSESELLDIKTKYLSKSQR